jgi:hypothetical protein
MERTWEPRKIIIYVGKRVLTCFQDSEHALHEVQTKANELQDDALRKHCTRIDRIWVHNKEIAVVCETGSFTYYKEPSEEIKYLLKLADIEFGYDYGLSPTDSQERTAQIRREELNCKDIIRVRFDITVY